MKLNVFEIVQATQGTLSHGSQMQVVSGVSIDSRRITPGDLFVPLKGNNCDGHQFIEEAFARGAQAAFIQKGDHLAGAVRQKSRNKSLIEVHEPLTALGDLACHWRKKFPIPIVAITGSNGKTTTKEMIGHIVSRRLATHKNPGNWNNLIGLPLSLLQLDEHHQAGVMEMGMSALGEIERLAQIAAPHIAAITNIGPAHLEQMKSVENIMQAKGELFAALNPEHTAVVNADDPRVIALARNTRAQILTFGMCAGDIRGMPAKKHSGAGTVIDLDIRGTRLTVPLALPGEMFLSNALAAAAVSHALGMNADDIKKGLESFQPIAGRMEVLRVQGVTVINDSYNANPVSVEAALKVLSSAKKINRAIAVLGDMLELGDQTAFYHRAAGNTAAQLGVDFLYLLGNFSSFLAEGALSGGIDEQHLFLCDSHEALATMLLQELRDGDVVLVKGSRGMKMEKIIEYLQRERAAVGHM